MKYNKKVYIFMVFAVIALLFMACEETNTGILIPVTGIELDKTEKQVMNVGDLLTLTATITPDNSTDKRIRWVSLFNNVAVFNEGLSATIYALFPGETVIYAVTEYGALITSYPIEVLEP